MLLVLCHTDTFSGHPDLDRLCIGGIDLSPDEAKKIADI